LQDLLNTLKHIPLSKHTMVFINELEMYLLLGDYEDAAMVARRATDELINLEGGAK